MTEYTFYVCLYGQYMLLHTKDALHQVICLLVAYICLVILILVCDALITLIFCVFNNAFVIWALPHSCVGTLT